MIADVADTHAALWYVLENPHLSSTARSFMDDAASAGDDIVLLTRVDPISQPLIAYVDREWNMGQRTPQEKKRLSLEKDRRNVYGEAPHAARKSIPLRKKLRNRADRHYQESLLPSGTTQFDADKADEIESSMLGKAPQVWDKRPDAPLGEVIARKLWRRATPKADRSRTVIVKLPEG